MDRTFTDAAGQLKSRTLAWLTRYFDLIGKLLLIMIFAVFTGYLFQHRGEIAKMLGNAESRYFICAFFLFLAFVLMEAHINTLLIMDMSGSRSEVREKGSKSFVLIGMKIIILSFFARYTPGKVWVLSLRLHQFGRMGTRTREVLSATFLENIYVLGTGLATFLIFTAFTPIGWGLKGFAGGVAVLLVLILHPGPVLSLFDGILKRLDHHVVGVRMKRTRSLGYIFYYLAAWVAAGSGAWFLSLSLGFELATQDIPYLIGAYVGSITLGFLAVFAPGGLGVREGLFALVMNRFGAPAEAMFLAVSARLVISIAEAASLGIVMAAEPFLTQNLNAFHTDLTWKGQIGIDRERTV